VQKWSFRSFQGQDAIKILLFLFLKQLCFANKPGTIQVFKYTEITVSVTPVIFNL